jgi:hypothetical protein
MWSSASRTHIRPTARGSTSAATSSSTLLERVRGHSCQQARNRRSRPEARFLPRYEPETQWLLVMDTPQAGQASSNRTDRKRPAASKQLDHQMDQSPKGSSPRSAIVPAISFPRMPPRAANSMFVRGRMQVRPTDAASNNANYRLSRLWKRAGHCTDLERSARSFKNCSAHSCRRAPPANRNTVS